MFTDKCTVTLQLLWETEPSESHIRFPSSYDSAPPTEPFGSCRPDLNAHVLYYKDMTSYDAVTSPLFNLLACVLAARQPLDNSCLSGFCLANIIIIFLCVALGLGFYHHLLVWHALDVTSFVFLCLYLYSDYFKILKCGWVFFNTEGKIPCSKILIYLWIRSEVSTDYV